MKPAIGYNPVRVEGGGTARWDGQQQRAPVKGELYLSGAHPMAYLAKNDFNTIYFIAVRSPK
jgi:hypothetical protein